MPCCAAFEVASFEAAFGQLWGAFVQLSGSILTVARPQKHLASGGPARVRARVITSNWRSSLSHDRSVCAFFLRKLPPGALKACVPIPGVEVWGCKLAAATAACQAVSESRAEGRGLKLLSFFAPLVRTLIWCSYMRCTPWTGFNNPGRAGRLTLRRAKGGRAGGGAVRRIQTRRDALSRLPRITGMLAAGQSPLRDSALGRPRTPRSRETAGSRPVTPCREVARS